MASLSLRHPIPIFACSYAHMLTNPEPDALTSRVSRVGSPHFHPMMADPTAAAAAAAAAGTDDWNAAEVERVRYQRNTE